MQRHNPTVRIMLLALLVILLILAAIGLAVILLLYPFEKPLPFLLGLATGGALSGVKLLMLEKSLNRTLDMESGHATNMARLHFILRYAVTIAVLALVVILRAYVGIIGTALGIFAMQLTVYVYGFYERIQEEKRFATQGVPAAIPYEDDEDEDTDKII